MTSSTVTSLQVNLGLNLLTKESVDPSVALPWWDKSRLLLHGTLRLSTGRANLLHLASRDPYNVTEHVCYDWKLMAMTWKPGNFTFTVGKVFNSDVIIITSFIG